MFKSCPVAGCDTTLASALSLAGNRSSRKLLRLPLSTISNAYYAFHFGVIPFLWPPGMEQDQEMDDAPQRILCSLVQTCNIFPLPT